MKSGGIIGFVCAAIAIAASCSVTSAFAQVRQFDVPSADAGKSLLEFARQARIEIIAPGDELHGVTTPPIKGTYDTFAALDLMLKGTDLKVRRSAGGIVTISLLDAKTHNEGNVMSPKNSVSVAALLLSAASLFGTAPAHAQSAGSASAGSAQGDATTIETVVVTGSRVITDIAASPTPLTVVSADQLAANTPNDIPTALNKLPVFAGSHSPTTTDNASSNHVANVIALRNFGAQRTLVLLDGARVTPSNADGTVDIDVLPQMLMSRVDVVTGGASAVYGSDAVTGVVNFVLDKHFTGIKGNMNAGISNYGDAASYQIGLAAGTDLFGGRGHIEGSLRHYHFDPVKQAARPYGRSDYVATGSGSATNPYVNTPNGRLNAFSFGGKITCAGTAANPCAANGQQFVSNGLIGPFNPGTATGTGNLSSGGDGTFYSVSSLAAMVNTDEAFGRFSYDLNDTTSAYVQVTAANAYDYHTHSPNYIQTGTVPNTFYKNNPFLSPAAQALLAGGTANTFQLAEFINDQGGLGFVSRGLDLHMSVTAGLEGTLFEKYNWNLFYTHGESHQKEDDPHNQNNAKMYAAEDAVLNSSGNPVCNVSTTSSASLYPGCVPMNPFGPTALTHDQYNYFTQDTNFVITYLMDDMGGSVSGDVVDLPAGPVKAALSSEYRELSYGVVSNAPPGFVNCTGLRLCNTATSQWQGNVSASQTATTENVLEFAAEADVPLLKDLPLVQKLSANLAGRYTDYSVSGPVETWKVGLDYQVNSDIRFRATTSIDIRAPTLNDLYSPLQINHAGFVDIHTGNVSQIALTETQGNANLVPEVARTDTAGVVLTPEAIPGLTASIDYYRIALKNAIGGIGGGSTDIQNLCENSGGTSPYCSLYVRPLPFSDHSIANYPSAVLTEQLNTALNRTEGWDVEIDYGFQMADLWETLPGSTTLRVLLNDQPFNDSVAYPGAPVLVTPVPKARITSFVGYTIGDWTFNLEDRWLSSFPRTTNPGVVFYQQPRGASLNYVDLNVDRKFALDDGAVVDAYFSVQNIANKTPPIEPTNVSTPGLNPGGVGSTNGNAYGFDEIGRYFTVGVRFAM